MTNVIRFSGPLSNQCETCGAEFLWIEHPLKPGVPMMSKCLCPPPTIEVTNNGATTIVTTTSRPRR